MPVFTPLPRETRAEAERLLRETDLTTTQIADRTGVKVSTVRYWLYRGGLRRPTGLGGRNPPPRAWTPGRRAAVARLYHVPRVDPGDLAEAIGAERAHAGLLFEQCGLADRAAIGAVPRGHRRLPPVDPESAPSAHALDAALRGHIARQIAALDAALIASLEGGQESNGRGAGGPEAGRFEAGRALRDLAGLKRLPDACREPDAAPRPRARRGSRPGFDRDGFPNAGGTLDGGGTHGGGETLGNDTPFDLAALREEIARRVEAFTAESEVSEVPGGPAGPGAERPRD